MRRCLAKQIATRAKTKRAPRTLTITCAGELVSKLKGLNPSRTSIIAAAAITVASIELRPSSAQ